MRTFLLYLVVKSTSTKYNRYMSGKRNKQVYVCVGIVRNAEGKILLTKRSESELPQAHEKWELPGGKIDFGETPQVATEREIFEETEYRVKAQSLLPKPYVAYWEYPTFYQHTIIFGFLCTILDTPGEIRTDHDHHVSEIQWYSRAEVETLETLPGVLFFIDQFNA